MSKLYTPVVKLPDGAEPIISAHIDRPSGDGEWRYPLVLASWMGFLAWFDHNGITQVGEFSDEDDALRTLKRRLPEFGIAPGSLIMDATALQLEMNS